MKEYITMATQNKKENRENSELDESIELDFSSKKAYDSSLEKMYMQVVGIAISRGLITPAEWEYRFKYYRDDAGHSFVHYLECILCGQKNMIFMTNNPIMIDHREELEPRFGVKITTMDEFTKNPKPLQQLIPKSQKIEKEKIKKENEKENEKNENDTRNKK